MFIRDNDYIVLVDEQNNILGTAPKLSFHHENTPLHRAFSLFVFNKKGELLLQQRSLSKKTWPGVWSNTVCGHLLLEDTPESAAKRRLKFELGMSCVFLHNALPDYRYKFEKNGIVENEICPVLVGVSDDVPIINFDEVNAVRWIAWKSWLNEVRTNAHEYSPWCVDETLLLIKNNKWKKKLKYVN